MLSRESSALRDDFPIRPVRTMAPRTVGAGCVESVRLREERLLSVRAGGQLCLVPVWFCSGPTAVIKRDCGRCWDLRKWSGLR